MEGVSDHPRGQDVIDGERPPAEVDGLGVHMTVVADGGGHRGHLFGRRTVREHVPTGHEGEFGSGEEAVADHQLIGRTSPGSRGGRVGVDPGPAGGDEDDGALTRRHQRSRIEDGRDPQPTRSTSAGPQAEFEGDLSAGRSHDAVDVLRE